MNDAPGIRLPDRNEGAFAMPHDILLQNLISPITLAFLMGVVATLIRSDLEIPEPILKILSIFLLLSIGIQGGRELSEVHFAEVAAAIGVTLILVVTLPLVAFLIASRVGRFDPANAAGIAALYGSVSSVTFLAAQNFAQSQQAPAEGFLAALIAMMEWGILVALLIGRFALAKEAGGMQGLGGIVSETLRGRGLVLLVGGLTMGFLIGDADYKRISPFFVDLFRGVLVLFLLEMGMTAARRLREFAQVGVFMLGFGIVVPVIFGAFGTLLGTLAGLSLGGAFVLGAVAASASYIDAPAAVRAALPHANPSIYLTSSLAITFPFNLIAGLPIYFMFAQMWRGLLMG
jgi:hypothetical protein